MKLKLKHITVINSLAFYSFALAIYWDMWKHGTYGVDENFFSLQHNLAYASLLLIFLLSAYGWLIYKEKKLFQLALFMLLTPVSGLFDLTWHWFFGIETTEKIWIIWSPPHILITLLIITGVIIQLQIINKILRRNHRQVIAPVCWAVLLVAFKFLLWPLDPFGPWHVLGFWGAGFFVFVLVIILLTAKDWFKTLFPSIRVVAFYIVVTVIEFTNLILVPSAQAHGHERTDTISETVTVSVTHNNPPAFLTVYSLLLVALTIDLSKRLPSILRGGIAGLLYSCLLYGFASNYFNEAFLYSTESAIVAIISGVAGGLMGGLIFPLIAKKIHLRGD
ncbi:MAG: hypothetical protein COT81_04815 [Candidatus Buchananbacteria bacterium CG10_big_fil_rev_8_21_14_0_10_42_9]|uniref:Uncharacterized protein n=1 Tax=Candidatus Buchananbacteria bacterium CG10_big_fil_rev_8_21_14_0_10_42_9 TaxID=1974526 RepID=A0A2H0W075_9BACT|nr:MAG: hypothetical protein COT81_04815 [Candidatus Buchananbacteria bacterium CG10_big_fil_rev_8_21_14_0_10_42_9]